MQDIFSISYSTGRYAYSSHDKTRTLLLSEYGDIHFECRHCKGSFKCYPYCEYCKEALCHFSPCVKFSEFHRCFDFTELHIQRQSSTTENVVNLSSNPFLSRISESESNTEKQNNLRQKIFPCSQCNKRFDRKSFLVKHVKTHSDEKPFHCNICGKRFNQNCKLNAHLKMHNGVKPFLCEFCKKKFSRKYGLVLHIRIHTGEKPYFCVICGKSFSRTVYLKFHQIRLHPSDE